jgi:hypothetical protein
MTESVADRSGKKPGSIWRWTRWSREDSEWFSPRHPGRPRVFANFILWRYQAFWIQRRQVTTVYRPRRMRRRAS